MSKSEVRLRAPFLSSRGAALLALAAFFACSCSGKGPAEEIESAAFVPKGSEVPGWSRDGAIQKFEGEDLYIYIDGGAEIYLEYGFERVLVQDLVSPDGRSISLEIFEMSGPESAFGMYTFKTSGKGKALDLGDGAELESYYLNSWKGPYLMTITGYGEDDLTLEGLVKVAQAVAAKIPVSGEKPALAKALLAMGYESGGIRFIKGLLGLNSVYSFSTARGFNFKAGVRGIDEKGNSLVVLEYATDVAAGKAFAELGEYLLTSDRFGGLKTPAQDFITVVDVKGQPLSFSARGPFLFVAIGTEPGLAEGLIDRVFEKLTGARISPP